MRYASLWNKRDKVEPAVLRALDQLLVPYVIAPPLDLWCWLGTRWVCVELKSGKAGTLTKGQKSFTDECHAAGRSYAIWRSVDEAISEVQQWRQRI